MAYTSSHFAWGDFLHVKLWQGGFHLVGGGVEAPLPLLRIFFIIYLTLLPLLPLLVYIPWVEVLAVAAVVFFQI